jgi:hypothetical protein
VDCACHQPATPDHFKVYFPKLLVTILLVADVWPLPATRAAKKVNYLGIVCLAIG